MPLQIFAFHDHPHAFAVTKANASLEECEFLLDFSRPLQRLRWFGVLNEWFGFTAALMVPVMHLGQEKGDFVVGVHRSEPYFVDIPNLWKKHRGFPRSLQGANAEPLQVVAAFGHHFAEDCAPR